MIIEKINIKSFGGLNDYVLRLSDGINIIQGNNESGKSTIANFILFCFYGLERGDKAKFTGWDGSVPSGSITVEDGEKHYRIERDRSCRIIDISSGEECFKGEVPGEHFFGIDVKTFRNTAFIGQKNGCKSEITLSTAIENILVSADESTDSEKTQKRIDELRTYLMHKNGNGGLIPALKKKRDELSARLENAKNDLQQSVKLQGQLTKAEAAFAEKSVLAHKTDVRIKYIRDKKLTEDFADCHKAKELEDKLSGQYNDMMSAAEYEGFIPEREYSTNVASLKQDSEKLLSDYNSAKKRINTIMSDNPELSIKSRICDSIDAYGGPVELWKDFSGTRKAGGMFNILGILFIICFFASLALCIYSIRVKNDANGAIIAGVNFGISLLAAFVSLYVYGKKKNHCIAVIDDLGVGDAKGLKDAVGDYKDLCSEINGVRDELDELTKNSEFLHNSYFEKMQKLDNLLKQWNKSTAEMAVSDCNMLYRLADEYKLGIEKQHAVYSALQSSLSLYDERQIAQEYRGISEEYAKLDTNDGKNVQELNREYNFYKGACNSLNNRIQGLNKQIAERKPAEDCLLLASELEAVEKELERCEYQLDVTIIAAEAMKNAANDITKNVTPTLSARAGEFLSSITQGRYDTLTVGNDLSMEYLASDDCSHNVSFMSEGTMDAAYISLRLALIETMCANDYPPAVFDESFIHLDDNRLDMVMKLLKNYSSTCNRQMIILTSHKREGVMAGDDCCLVKI